MALYCPRCQTGFGQPIEMEEAESHFTYTIYRCPRCLHMRKVTHHLVGMDDIEDVTKADLETNKSETKKSGLLKKAAKVAGIGILGAAVLAALADKGKDGK